MSKEKGIINQKFIINLKSTHKKSLKQSNIVHESAPYFEESEQVSLSSSRAVQWALPVVPSCSVADLRLETDLSSFLSLPDFTASKYEQPAFWERENGVVRDSYVKY